MSRRRRYTAVHREGLRVVSRLLREAVWDMTGADDYASVLATLTDGFSALRIPVEGCGIYVIDPGSEPPAVTGQYVLREGRWRPALPSRDRDTAVELWREAATTYVEDVRDEAPELNGALHLRFGAEMRSVVDVPFTNGVLTVASSKVDAFRGRDIEMLREVAEGMPSLFYRMEDLRQMELRDRQIVHAQNLEMVGRLAAGTSHEVNNALTVILGQCELLLMDELDASVRESLEIVLKAGDSTRALVAGVLELARGHEPERHTVDLNQLVRDSALMVRRQLARDQVELVEQLSADVPLVHVQSGQIQQIVLNLVHNSRDAILATSRRGCIRLRTWSVDGTVRLAVEDDGPGVPDRVRERIFEPFYSTKENGKGTGLGLSVCRTIAGGHGGSLYVTDAGPGACFVLELPRADQAALQALN